MSPAAMPQERAIDEDDSPAQLTLAALAPGWRPTVVHLSASEADDRFVSGAVEVFVKRAGRTERRD